MGPDTAQELPPEAAALIEQVQAYHQNLAAAQVELSRAEVVAESADDLVRVTMSGMGELRQIHIDPKLLTAGDSAYIGNHVLQTIRSAARAAGELAAHVMGRPVEISVY